MNFVSAYKCYFHGLNAIIPHPVTIGIKDIMIQFVNSKSGFHQTGSGSVIKEIRITNTLLALIYVTCPTTSSFIYNNA